MKEITRYDVVLVDGVPAHRPSESGRWVKHEDLAAIQEQLSQFSMSAGHADQRKVESVAVRVALGFSADADDVSPSDLVDAIASIQEQVRVLADLVPDAMPAHNKGAHIDATAHWCDGFNACRAAVLRRIDGVKNAK